MVYSEDVVHSSNLPSSSENAKVLAHVAKTNLFAIACRREKHGVQHKLSRDKYPPRKTKSGGDRFGQAKKALLLLVKARVPIFRKMTLYSEASGGLNSGNLPRVKPPRTSADRTRFHSQDLSCQPAKEKHLRIQLSSTSRSATSPSTLTIASK